MAKIDMYNMEGSVVGEIELSDAIFGIEPNEDVVHIVVKNQLANKRQGTHSTKTRGEVSGGGKRPYRQKGTGRARHGSIRSAQYVGGGVIFGPKPRNYRYTVPKKVRRLALKSVFSSKLSNNKIIVVDEILFNEIKTKQMVSMLKALNVDSTALLILEDKNINVEKSSRNIPGIWTSKVNTINVLDLLKYDMTIMTQAAAQKIQEVYV